MANPWLRLYAEIRRDPKVRTMPETFQLRLIWLLTLRCEGMTEKMSNEELMYGLDCDEATLEKIHQTFLDKGFIEQDWSLTNWNKRQYISDSSTPRVHKFRALKRGETLHETEVKRAETQNETDQNRTEQNRTKQNRIKTFAQAELERVYEAYPRKVGKGAALKAIERALRRIAPLGPDWLVERTRQYALSREFEDPQYTPHPQTWFNQERYNDGNDGDGTDQEGFEGNGSIASGKNGNGILGEIFDATCGGAYPGCDSGPGKIV